MAKIEFKESGCWEFRGVKRHDGYGLIWSNGRPARAHRISYEIFNGPLQKSDCILHTCDNRKCVNPAHLSVGTRADNMRDAIKRQRLRYGESHPGAKLSTEQVQKIRSDPRSQSKIAADYGVTQSVISRIKSGISRAIAG